MTVLALAHRLRFDATGVLGGIFEVTEAEREQIKLRAAALPGIDCMYHHRCFGTAGGDFSERNGGGSG
jgi:hypothetical protein